MHKVQVELPARSTSPRDARRAVSRLLRTAGVDGDQVEDVLLIVSELVTNAIRHAGTSVDFVAELEPGGIVLRVTDRDAALPRPGSPRLGQAGGWGLHLVEQMATEWGCEPCGNAVGKTVWAELPLALPADRG